MVEQHVLSGHIYGTLTKTELNDDWTQRVIYKKYVVYLGMKKRFKMSKSAGALLKIVKGYTH
jgi:hypothetical protein